MVFKNSTTCIRLLYILSDLKSKLLELKHDTTQRKQIAQARTDLAIEKHAGKLINFYDSL